MRGVKQFEEFIDKNTVKKQSPDKSRADFLIKESEKSFRALEKRIDVIGINNDNANSIVKDCYDIIMELIRAKLLFQGFNASGKGAHAAEVSYLRKLGFSEKDVQFVDQLRYFRNGMIYYGKILDREYAEKVVEFTKEFYSKMESKLK